MKITYITKDIETALIQQFGTHSAVAAALGVSYRRYCQLRKWPNRPKVPAKIAIKISNLIKKSVCQ